MTDVYTDTEYSVTMLAVLAEHRGFAIRKMPLKFGIGGLKMTLDEAIRHCEEVAENYRYQRDDAVDINDVGAASDCQQCADDHEQLAKWLQEFKEAKKFIRKVENELMKGTSFYSTSFLEENRELFDKLTEGVEYLDD